jgi:hypothetical protein
MRLLLVLALVTQAHAQRPVLIDQDGSAPDPGSSNQMAMMVLQARRCACSASSW